MPEPAMSNILKDDMVFLICRRYWPVIAVIRPRKRADRKVSVAW